MTADVNALLAHAAHEDSGRDYPPYHGDEEPPDSAAEAEAAKRSIRNISALKRAEHEDTKIEAAQEWKHDPADVFGRFEVPDLDPECVMPELLDFCYDQHERTGADVVQFVAMTASACASAIRESIRVQVKRRDYEWKQRACIWTAIVGNPGVNKTGPQDISYAHLWAAEIDMRAASIKAQKDYAKKMRKYAIDEAAYMRDKSPMTMEPEEPEPPEAERLLGEDMTIEGMRDLLLANPRGKITVYARELAQWLASFDAYSNNGATGRDRAAFLQANDGGPRPVDRANRSVLVPSWSACVVGGIQPDVLQMHLYKTQGFGTGDGLMQRFNFFMARESVADEDRPPNQQATDRYRTIIDNLVAMQPRGTQPVIFADDAHTIRESLRDWAHELRASPIIPAGMVGWLNKAHAQFARWCLVYACIEAAARGEREAPLRISAEIAARVKKLFIRVLEPHQRLMYLQCLGGTSPVGKAMQAIAGKLLILPDGPNETRQIYRNLPAYAWDELTWQQRREVFARLENTDWVRPLGTPKASTGLAPHYALHPRRCELYAEEMQRERQRRAESRRPFNSLGRPREPGED